MFLSEDWKYLLGGPYEISSHGRVRRSDTKELKKLTCHFPAGKAYVSYHHATFVINGKRRTLNIHRLVAQLFIPNPDNLPQVNHKDTNGLNNRIDNLEWCTAKQNIAHTIALGRHGIFHKRASPKGSVCFYKRYQKYHARIRLNKRTHHIGYFATLDQAQSALVAFRNSALQDTI